MNENEIVRMQYAVGKISFDISRPAFHEGAWTVLLNSGCPASLAYKAAQVIGQDNPYADNLGRGEKDQEIIRQVLPYIQRIHE